MCLVGLVSFLVFAAVGVNAQTELKSSIDTALEAAVSEVGRPLLGDSSEKSSASSTAVYSLTVLADGSSYETQASTAYMSEELVDAAVEAATASEQDAGELADLGLFYRTQQIEAADDETTIIGTRLAFADSSAYAQQVQDTYLQLLAMWCVLMVCVLVISLLLARYVAKPIKEAWQNQQRFIADASHELKTPLTVILADASILAENPHDTIAEQMQWVDGINAEATRMQQLTEGMLTLAQADAGEGITALMDRLDYSQLIELSLLQFEAVAFERGLTIVDHIDDGITVKGDQLRLEGLIKTLLENACKYARKPSSITVTLTRSRAMSVLTVHNANANGPIPPKDLPHVFDRFYRSDASRVHKGETTSFGLGLSIAKSTAEAHGGAIGVESNDDGTSFTVKIPLAK